MGMHHSSVSTSASRVSSFQVNQSSYGVPIKLIFGTNMISGCLIDYQDFTAIAHTTTTSSGGKGGGGVTQTDTTYTYTVAGAIALGEGTLTGVGKIWQDSKTTDMDSLGLTFFNGAKGQTPWGYMTSKHPDHALGYNGTAYVAGVVDLGDSASLPNMNFEVFGLCQSYLGSPSRDKMQQYAYCKEIEISNFASNQYIEEYVFDSATSTGSWVTLDSRFYEIEQSKDQYGNYKSGVYKYTFNFDDRSDGYDRVDPTFIRIHYTCLQSAVTYTPKDANPRDIIHTLLTSTVFGENFPDVLVDDLSVYGDYCESNQLLLSPVYEEQTACSDIIGDLMEATNSEYVFSQGKVKIIPYYDGLEPIYNLTDDDFINQGEDTINIERTSQADTYNIIPLEHTDRANDYNTNVVYATDEGDIELHGVRQAGTYSHHEIMSQGVAQAVAQLILQKQLYNRNRYTVRLGQEYILLEPMDVCTLQSDLANLGISSVRVVEIKENESDFTLDITFEDNLSGTTSAPKYETQNVDRANTNYNQSAGDINTPVMFEAPIQLVTSATGYELWLYCSGESKWWGGADVWISEDNNTYKRIGRIESPATQGVTTNTLPIGENPDQENVLSIDLSMSRGELSGGTQADADALRTLCWCNGEFMAYEKANLTATYGYDLSYLVRGAYGSTIEQHGIGDKFVRCNDTVLKYPFTADEIGKTFYFKFTSYNIYGSEEQELSDVKAYQYTVKGKITERTPMPPTNVTYNMTYRRYVDGSTGYDINLDFELPKDAYVTTALCYYKTDHADMTFINTINEGTPVDELGFDVEWSYAGDGTTSIVIPAAHIGDTYKIKLVSRTRYGTVTTDDDAYYMKVQVVGRSEVPNTPQNFKYDFSISGGFKFLWDDVTNTDIYYYELRNNTNKGSMDGLLAKAKGNNVVVNLTNRKDTIYLYAVNTQKQYSIPAEVTYDYPIPEAPAKIVITKAPLSVNIDVTSLIGGVEGIRLFITNTNYSDTIDLGKGTHYTFSGKAGIYDVEACYYDVFGDGEHTDKYEATIEPYFDEEWIKDGSLSIEKMDKTINDAVDRTIANANAILDTNNQVSQSAKDILSINDSITELKQQDGLLQSTITNLDNQTASRFTQTDNKISTTVADAKADMASMIEQTANSLKSTITSLDNKTASQFEQTNEKIETTVANAEKGLASSIQQNANSITTIVTNLNSTDKAKSYSAISSMVDAINLRVQKGDIINQINMTPQGTTIDGKYLHVTGSTLFDNNVIVSGMIKAGAISTDKLAAGSVTADKLASDVLVLKDSRSITGGSATLNKDGMFLTLSDGSKVTFTEKGILWYTKTGNIFNAITPTMIIDGKDGQYCKFNGAWSDIPMVYILEAGEMKKVTNPTTGFECRGDYMLDSLVVKEVGAYNVTRNGFSLRNSLRYKAGKTISYINGVKTKSEVLVDENWGWQAYYSCRITKELTVPIDLPNQKVELYYELIDRSWIDSGSNSGANNPYIYEDCSISSVFYLNDVKQGEHNYNSSLSQTTKYQVDYTFNLKKGDVLKLVSEINENGSGSASSEIRLVDFTLNEDIILEQGTIQCLAIDRANATQYTLIEDTNT